MIGWIPTSVADSTWRVRLDKLLAARGLPGAIEIVMHQFAALALANDFSEPVGCDHQARYFVAAGRQWRRGIQLRIGKGIDGIGHLRQRPHNSARYDQDHRARDADGDEAYENLGVGEIGLVERRQQRRGQKWTGQRGGQRQKNGRSKPLGDRELPHALSSRTRIRPTVKMDEPAPRRAARYSCSGKLVNRGL